MDQALNYLTLNTAQFHQLPLRARVFLRQLPLSVTILAVAAGSLIFHPEVLGQEAVRTGLLLSAVLLLATVTVPWHRLPASASLAIPLLDFIPLAFLREGGGITLSGVGLLAAFPVIWLAGSGLYPRALTAACFVGPLLMVWMPVLISGASWELGDLRRPLMIPFMMLAIGITIRVMTASMLAQQRVVQAQDARLRELLAATARRERLVHSIVEAVDVGVLATDEAGREILVNRRQQGFRRLMDPAAPGPELGPLDRAARGETFSNELIRLGERPLQRVLSASARTMKDDDGRHEGSVITFHDVTELVAALNAKDAFVSNVSHELRTPLTSILGYAELLQMTPDLSRQTADGLEVIVRNSERLLALVNDLLTAVAGTHDIRPVPADFTEIIDQSIAAAEPHAAAAGIRLVAERPARLPAIFDPGRMGQVLDNLVSNAIKYSPGGGTVTVRSGFSGGELTCAVVDQGMGMSAPDVDEVFDKFFRSRAARQAAIPGVGLGLPIARSIVLDHGGSIDCESELGVGTTFSFTLPLQHEPVPAS